MKLANIFGHSFLPRKPYFIPLIESIMTIKVCFFIAAIVQLPESKQLVIIALLNINS